MCRRRTTWLGSSRLRRATSASSSIMRTPQHTGTRRQPRHHLPQHEPSARSAGRRSARRQDRVHLKGWLLPGDHPFVCRRVDGRWPWSSSGALGNAGRFLETQNLFNWLSAKASTVFATQTPVRLTQQQQWKSPRSECAADSAASNERGSPSGGWCLFYAWAAFARWQRTAAHSEAEGRSAFVETTRCSASPTRETRTCSAPDSRSAMAAASSGSVAMVSTDGMTGRVALRES